MKLFLYPLLLAALGCASVFADPGRYVTLTASSTNTFVGVTNSVAIGPNETGEVVSYLGWSAYAAVVKDGRLITIASSTLYGSVVVQGPALFQLVSNGENASLLTVRITPGSFPPDKTILIPPGTNQVAVALESSTNLVHWFAATNGVYGSPGHALFFRIKAERVN